MHQPASGGGRKGLIIGAVLLVLVLVGGGIAAVFALGGDDEDDASASEETSQTEEGSDTDEGDDEATSETTAAGTDTFEATNFDEVGRVCHGEAMGNAAPWDPAAPVGLPFSTQPSAPDDFHSTSLGTSQSWSLKEYGAFETVNFVLCIEGAPSTTAQVRQCENRDGSYEWHPYDWSVTLREATSSEVLHELDQFVEERTECPRVAVVDSDRVAYTALERDAVEGAVNAWLTAEGGGAEGEGAPFEATSYRDLARVCMGGAATNQPAFDLQKPKGNAALNTERAPNYAGYISIGTSEPWGTEFQDWEKVNFLVCVDGRQSESIPPRKCKSEEKEVGRFDFVQLDYHLTVREVSTGEVLAELDPLLPEFDQCPMFAFVDEDGVYSPSVDPREVSERVNVWLAQEKKRR